MLYVSRDSDGNVTGLTLTPTGEKAEQANLSDPEVAHFLSDSDFGLIRVIEDLVDVLVGKNVINITDLPESAQLKLLYRKGTRDLLDERKCFLLSEDKDQLF